MQTARFPTAETASRTSGDFEAAHFPELAGGQQLANEGARNVLAAVRNRRDDFLLAERMARGELIPPHGGAFSSVEQSLFQSLLGELDQRWLLPIMLASRSLDLEYQRRLLLDLALFAFRYGVVCNAPLGPFERTVRGSIDLLNTEPRPNAASSLPF